MTILMFITLVEMDIFQFCFSFLQEKIYTLVQYANTGIGGLYSYSNYYLSEFPLTNCKQITMCKPYINKYISNLG